MNEKDNPWTILAENSLYDNPWINVTEFQVINPGGGRGIYGKVHFKNLAIGIIPLDDQRNTWLVGQYRFPLNQYSWEIPEGGGTPGTDPVISAQRELKEETGLEARVWTEIQRIHLSNSVSDELGIVYIARELTQGISSPEETEQLVIRKLAFDEVYEMVINGAITDSLSVAGILKVRALNLA